MAKIKILAIGVAKLFLTLILFFHALDGQKRTKIVAKQPTSAPAPVHSSFHPDQDDLWESTQIEYVTIFGVFDGGDMYYHDSGEVLKVRWDLGTIFVVPKNRGRLSIQGCSLVLFCKKHRVAYYVEQVQCVNL